MESWLQLGGIYAVANVRGGGEYGRAWHEGATGAQKQSSIDDFVAAARFLVDQRYTRPSLLGVTGHAAGGLMAAAAITQRPEMFGAAVINAGLLDMTRFNHFSEGPWWIPEFGSPERAADLRVLLEYSPLQNVRAGTRYPGTLISVGDHDEVATPGPSFKFAAALQALTSNSAPALLRTDLNAGFGPGTSLASVSRSTATNSPFWWECCVHRAEPQSARTAALPRLRRVATFRR